MRKIPQHVSDYIDVAIERERRIFDAHLTSSLSGLGTMINSQLLEFRADVDARLLEFYLHFKDEMKHQTGTILDEFDSRLKTMGEYVDTKTTKEEVRQIIYEEKGR